MKGLERKSSFLSDATFESISESETSTAPSSLQTIIRAPYVIQHAGPYHPSAAPVNGHGNNHTNGHQKMTDSESEMLTSANNLRKVSEQLLNTSRTRNSISRPGSVALSSTPQMNYSRHPMAARSAQVVNNRTSQIPSNRPHSYAAGPQNTVGLPSVSNTPTTSTPKYSSQQQQQSPSSELYPESNGLLSTISQVIIFKQKSKSKNKSSPKIKDNNLLKAGMKS